VKKEGTPPEVRPAKRVRVYRETEPTPFAVFSDDDELERALRAGCDPDMCARCGGSGGGPDVALRCPACRGTGYSQRYFDEREEARAEYLADLAADAEWDDDGWL